MNTMEFAPNLNWVDPSIFFRVFETNYLILKNVTRDKVMLSFRRVLTGCVPSPLSASNICILPFYDLSDSLSSISIIARIFINRHILSVFVLVLNRHLWKPRTNLRYYSEFFPIFVIVIFKKTNVRNIIESNILIHFHINISALDMGVNSQTGVAYTAIHLKIWELQASKTLNSKILLFVLKMTHLFLLLKCIQFNKSMPLDFWGWTLIYI